ncbi:6029_t:CDS:1, partial [Dentiscutata erythropus]
AFDCFEESISDARSCFYLGILYEKGLGINKDLWQAKIWYNLCINDIEDENTPDHKAYLPLSYQRFIE